MRALRCVALLAVPLALCGCSKKAMDEFFGNVEPEPYPVLVIVERDPGVPIIEAPVLYKGKLVKTTDEKGTAFLQLQKPDGEEVELVVTCPPDTKQADPLRIKVRRVKGQRYLEQHVNCLPMIRHIAISVRADDGPGLPVSYLGEVKATTDASGAAHFLMEVAPNQSIKLRIDASGNPKLKPSSDEVAFQVQDRDDMFSVYSKFSTDKKVYRGGPRRTGPKAL